MADEVGSRWSDFGASDRSFGGGSGWKDKVDGDGLDSSVEETGGRTRQA
jgi:hypothetical protein